MNLSILILPALLGTLAVSAAQTLPADLRHDAAGKTPLTVARMAVARGAGSTCRLGCNEPNVYCQPVDENPDDGKYSQYWNQHFECGFALGSDTCTPGPDDTCNIVYTFSYNDPTCSEAAIVDYTTSSVCPAPATGD